MRTYTIHRGPPDEDGEPRYFAVKEGFCWPVLFLGAFFLAALWPLWHRLWLVTIVIAAAELAVGWLVVLSGADPVSRVTMNVAVHVLIALVANDLWRWSLDGRGYDEVGVVAAEESEAALRRHLSTAGTETSAPWKAPRAGPVLPPPSPDPLLRP